MDLIFDEPHFTLPAKLVLPSPERAEFLAGETELCTGCDTEYVNLLLDAVGLVNFEFSGFALATDATTVFLGEVNFGPSTGASGCDLLFEWTGTAPTTSEPFFSVTEYRDGFPFTGKLVGSAEFLVFFDWQYDLPEFSKIFASSANQEPPPRHGEVSLFSAHTSAVFVCFSNDLSLHSAEIRGKSKFLLFSRNDEMSNETFPSPVSNCEVFVGTVCRSIGSSGKRWIFF